jgi:toxin ParE1/3/4
MKITYDEGVFEELVDLSIYLADHDEDVAHRFLDACDATFRFIAANPQIGSPFKFRNPALSNVRMWRVKGFEKYLIFYIPSGSGIRLLHILHSAYDYNRAFEDQ